MHRPGLLTLGLTLLAALLATPARAEFEGVIEMKMTAEHGSGTMRTSISKVGWRTEIDMQVDPSRPGPKMPMHTVMLGKFKNPDVLYQINDATRTYTELDLKKLRKMGAQRGAQEQYTVRRIGKEKLLGYPCAHVLVTSSQGQQSELWTTKAIPTGDYMAGMGGDPASSGGLMKALKEAKADGFILKMVQKEAAGGEPAMTMEVVKVDRRSLPASTFELPPGYTREEGGMGLGMPPEAKERMREMMKNLTPEQRKMMEEQLRQLGQ